MRTLRLLNATITECTACPRLVAYRQKIAETKRRQFQDWTYWGRPVPGFGDPNARVYVLGLAPAAHGGNRTGRVFTGDRSGDWLYEALHRYGFANQPSSTHRGDGLVLRDCYVGATVRCAPPGNKPTPGEFERCRRFLRDELRLLPRLRVVIALGKIAFDHYLRTCRLEGRLGPSPAPKFRHGAAYRLPWGVTLIGSYHPSQQNTFTGKLTRSMFHAVFARARRELSRPARREPIIFSTACPSRLGTFSGRYRSRDA
jgi:uracil-DNA glycosylase family 4